jgi:hypothetical protein
MGGPSVPQFEFPRLELQKVCTNCGRLLPDDTPIGSACPYCNPHTTVANSFGFGDGQSSASPPPIGPRQLTPEEEAKVRKVALWVMVGIVVAGLVGFVLFIALIIWLIVKLSKPKYRPVY